ncbi:DUF6801 domain-containing protein [Actinokineospora bangkokensis]|uniref:DUF6801 domain-containing protein n=1 Tax=Actinokineospora bangkokensis TaxID=1193682 RepID=A0A1Q9LSA1_9PSEU|nr:DUF6801 domain-containing protein [Actinokineospora bangkokensis]OLR94912.1 hypothetical protein BJP25_08005 [Actinokineospora bangkokensis]
MTTLQAGKTKRVFAGGGVIAALTALALLLFGTGGASAAEKTLTFSGEFPLIGTQQVSTAINVEIPASATPGQTVSTPFSISVDAGASATDGLRLVGTTKISGSIAAAATVTLSDGQSVDIPVELPIAETPVPASGNLTFTAEGSVDFTVPTGVASGAATVSVASSANSHIVTDSSLGEFDVALTLDEGQDATLGTTQVG